MVSRATKRFWKSVAIGLALSPASALSTPAWAQAPGSSPTISAVGDAASAKPASEVESVRKLLQEGRKALAEGDKVRAEKLARQAQALHVQMPFWETDTPEKLLLDIGVKGAAPVKGAMPTGDPKMLVKQGYEALRVGKLDDAQKCAQAAASNPKAKWGLFEDNPTKLLDEIAKARKARDKEQSGKVLTDARKLYEQGKYSDARNMAYKASALHGPYAMWDMGDRPEKLIADIDSAEAKNRKVKAPATSGSKPADSIAAKTTKPNDKPAAPNAIANSVVQQPKPTDKSATPNKMPTSVVQQTKPPAPNFGSEVKTADVAAATPTTNDVTTAAGIILPGAVNNPVVPVSGDPKAQAKALMAEGKGYWQAGRYVEARAKYAEAAQCRCQWTANEETPDRCLAELSATVMKQMETVMAETAAAVTAEQKKAYETRLRTARDMAAGFNLECTAIDAQLAGVHAQVEAIAAAATNAAGMIQGQVKLDKARLELRSGQCEMARQIAAEVFNGPYGMQAEAAQVLRSVDVEEHNQKVLAANRGCDAALTAYRNHDFAQAAAVFNQVDADLLPGEKKLQMKEAMATCQARMAQPQTPVAAATPIPTPGVVTADVSKATSEGVKTTGATGITGIPGGVPTMTAPASGDNLAAQVQMMQEIEYQRLRAEGQDVQSKAMDQFKRGETDAALESLDSYCKRVRATKLDAAAIARLCRPIEAKEQSFKLLKPIEDDKFRNGKSRENFLVERGKEQTAEMKRQQQVKDLMKQFNTLYNEGKYKEAEVAAQKAHELDPDDPTTIAAVKLAEIHGASDSFNEIQARKDKMFLEGMNKAEDPGKYVDTHHPVELDLPILKIAQGRAASSKGIGIMKHMSEKDKEIYSKLSQSVTVSFSNVPLSQALYDLQAMKAMNIHIDRSALAAESINPDTPVSLKVDNISLKAALKLMLEQLHLRYVVKDEVVKVTTEKAARGDLEQRVFSVADLVIPIDDYMMPQMSNIGSAFDRVIEQQRNNLGTGSGATPFGSGKFMLQNGETRGSSMNASMSTAPAGVNPSTQPGSTGSSMSYSGAVSPTRQTMQDMLIKLVTNTIAPDTWSSVGGAGTIDYMPIGLALVVNQTPDVQEQVADLLDALRKLQDLEVSVEVRIITLAETFFERIGLDMALNIKTDKVTSQYEPQLVTGQFKPAGQVNDFSPSRFISGITGISSSGGSPGDFTSNLDIPIKSSSFQYAIPPFAYPNSPGQNGGLSMGLAFLSDIQVYMFMEAAQGDRRTNVMQAPKLTLFNGQTATINVSDQQFFVTNVNVVGFGGQIVFVPTNNPFPLGVQLTIQAVVSADRRFVRLNLAPTLSNIASAIVPLFPVTTFITPVFEGGAQGQPIPFTQFIQQPQISTVSIQTTVSIPDGGTVILGGLKTLSEGRNEFGPPVLSKLPYINRLFKNVGYGREAQSLLLMVTPRIIINSEEEERQTGVNSEATQPR